MTDGLLGPAEVRSLAQRWGIRPTKALGQNFLHDANTIRRIVRIAGLGVGASSIGSGPEAVSVPGGGLDPQVVSVAGGGPDPQVVSVAGGGPDLEAVSGAGRGHVLEVGPGLGSLTLGLLPFADRVTAVEIDPVLAAAVRASADERLPDIAARLHVHVGDALRLRPADLPAGPPPTRLVANLPYNIAVPVVLHLLEEFPTVSSVLVLVQAEVAQRLAAGPGSRTYGVPSVKAAWYGAVRRAGTVGRTVFWPEPNVDSELVSLTRRPPPQGASRAEVFAVVDAAFAQRRKTLRAALGAAWGSPVRAETVLLAAGVDPRARGESVDLAGFVSIAAAARDAG